MKLISLSFILICGTLFWFLRPQDEEQESIARGKEIFGDFCTACHMTDGKGVEGSFPPLAGSDYLMNNREASIRGVKYGQTGPLTVNGIEYNNTMIPMGLEDGEIADVMNYILNSWGNENPGKMVTEEEVSGIAKN